MSTDSAPILTDVMPDFTAWRPRESSVAVGLGRVDITPPVGIRAHNWGAAREGQATGIHHPLTATALAVSAAGRKASYLVTADLGWWGSVRSFRTIFDPIIAGLGIEPDDLLLHLIHTHAGPSLNETNTELPGGDMVEPYRERLIEAIIEAVRAADATIAPATITWGYGKCQLAVNRDLPCGSRDVVAFNPLIEADDTVAVGRVTDATGALIATIANYACHPTTLAYHNSLISPDFIGAARELVEASTSAPMLFLQGASGELSPRDQYLPGTETTDRNGRSLGHAVLAALSTMGTPGTELGFDGTVESGAPLGIWQERAAAEPGGFTARHFEVQLRARKAPTDEELARTWSHIDPVAAKERTLRALRQAEGYARDGLASHPVWLWHLGDALVVAQPGEAFSYLQTELRRRNPERMILVLNLTNGPGFGYIPSREAYQYDRYQVWQTLLEEGSLEQLVDAIDEVIATLPSARRIVA